MKVLKLLKIAIEEAVKRDLSRIGGVYVDSDTTPEDLFLALEEGAASTWAGIAARVQEIKPCD